MAVNDLLTAGDIARRYRLTRSAVNYAIEKAGITPVGWIGNARVFSRSQLPSIRAALESVHVRAMRIQSPPSAPLKVVHVPDTG